MRDDKFSSFFVLKMISLAYLLGCELKLIFLWKAKLLILDKSLFNSVAEVFTWWIVENKAVFSAYNLAFDDR